MRNVLIIILLQFFAVILQAQDWIQVRSMNSNNSESVWMRKDSALIRSTLFIHDTIYIDSFRIKLFTAFAFLQKFKNQKENKKDSLFKPSLSNYSTGRAYYHKIKIAKTSVRRTKYRLVKKINKKKQNTTLYVKQYILEPCTPDTIRGILLYNNRIADEYDGNTYDSGIWVGCSPHFINGEKIFLLPSFYKETYYDDKLVKHTSAIKNGKFYTKDFTPIGNWRVYGLILN